ncbi:MAG: hypothetical protein ACSLFO_04510 [Acidimicrobiales bacterium]
MTRRPRARLALAAVLTAVLTVLTATLTVGTSIAVGPAGASTGDIDGRSPIAAVGQHLWPVDALDVPTVLVAAASEPIDAATSPLTPVDVAATHATPEPAYTTPVTATPDPATPAPTTPAPTTPPPVLAEEPAVMITGTIHVDATATEGAARTVTLRSADGSLVAGPVTIDGNRITFEGLDDGTYDVLAEQFFDGGGTFVTRTIIDVAGGGETVVACHPETLDCTVS